jgi:hypothetical protein
MKKGSWFMVITFSMLVVVSNVMAVDFTGNSTGVFGNPTGPSGMLTTGVGTNNFTWGDGTPFSSPPSSLLFTGGPFSGVWETEFKFGHLDYFNGTIAADTEANSVALFPTLSFSSPFLVNLTFGLTFQLINTANTADPIASADYVKLDQLFDPAASWVIGTDTYYFQFTRFANTDSNGFITTVNEFHVLEAQTAGADVFAKLTTRPTNSVPEPGTLALIISSLVVLVGLRRKLEK